ncbi:hypothetical protein [Cellulomonas marina]|uniref:Secreted protein n=1 Tax=Cellulomonas marina TaxID=988821 RepID=A0A1I0VCF3_9CELL|nr:hypothetical protein [Cellulomonas marina]GIG28042.1 hypothetical protein Cma02nite_06420 [Cellulomonas marina]SFA74089.1 hypothetical protein SAMN05421867_101319 [Cellulomonas marina]
MSVPALSSSALALQLVHVAYAATGELPTPGLPDVPAPLSTSPARAPAATPTDAPRLDEAVGRHLDVTA